MNQHKLKFENTRRAAEYNAKILKQYKHDLTKIIRKEAGTMLDPGSEFREVEILEPLFKHHRLWSKMRNIMDKGVEYPLDEIQKEELQQDLQQMIARGNQH